MIEYKFKEEVEILRHYAKKMKRESIESILDSGCVAGKQQALLLSTFYWDMLDEAANDQGRGLPILESEGIAVWMEYIFHSLNGYLVSNGYEEQWDQE